MTTTREPVEPTRAAPRRVGAPGTATAADAAPTASESPTFESAETPRPGLSASAPSRWEHARESAAAVLAVAWRHIARVAAVVRPLGWVALALAAVLWFAAVAYGWSEAMVAAAVVTAALALSIPFLFGRTAYGVDLDLTRTRVVVGERAVGALTLTNGTGRALLPSEVVLPVGAGRGVFDVPRLAAGSRTRSSSRSRPRRAVCSQWAP